MSFDSAAPLTRPEFSALAVLGAVLLAACPGARRAAHDHRHATRAAGSRSHRQSRRRHIRGALRQRLRGLGAIRRGWFGAAKTRALMGDLRATALTYVFHLKSGVRFHDGSEFDAAAAKFSLERILAPGSTNPQRARLQAIRAVEVVDPLTLRVLLSRRSGGLLQVSRVRIGGRWCRAHPPRTMRCGPSARVRFASCDGGAATPSPSSAIRITRGRPRC